MCRQTAKAFFLILFIAVSQGSLADGLAVDRVYEPYVNPLEKELEYRLVQVNESESGREKDAIQRLGFSAAVTERLALEAYVIADDYGESTIDAYELEARYQLTEQGEYAVDWGLLFEYERERSGGGNELAGSVLMASQWKKIQTTANVSLIYEKAKDGMREFDTNLSVQAKYMFRRYLEPALEFYAGENYRGIGPVLIGTLRLAGANSLRWELGGIIGLDNDSEDEALRFLLEYEFY